MLHGILELGQTNVIRALLSSFKFIWIQTSCNSPDSGNTRQPALDSSQSVAYNPICVSHQSVFFEQTQDMLHVAQWTGQGK